MGKHLKPAAEAPKPAKFAPGDRVKPTPVAVGLLWTKHGEVTDCLMLTVDVRMDGEAESHPYRIDMWEPE